MNKWDMLRARIEMLERISDKEEYKAVLDMMDELEGSGQDELYINRLADFTCDCRINRRYERGGVKNEI